MFEKDKTTAASDETTFSRQVATGGPQAEGPASWPNKRLVRPGNVGARRLDGGHSDRGRRGPGYLDRRRYPSSYSWALMLLLVGLVMGCLNAWHWVHSEYQEMQEDTE